MLQSVNGVSVMGVPQQEVMGWFAQRPVALVFSPLPAL